MCEHTGSCPMWKYRVAKKNNIFTFSHGEEVFGALFPGGSDGKASAYSAGDPGSIPGSGRPSGEGYGTPLQYSCLENPMDRGVW